jgi:hypothetical protein
MRRFASAGDANDPVVVPVEAMELRLAGVSVGRDASQGVADRDRSRGSRLSGRESRADGRTIGR